VESDIIKRLIELLEQVNKKASLFYQAQQDSGLYELNPGKVNIYYEPSGRAFISMTQNSHGLQVPVWNDLTLNLKSQPEIRFGLDLDLPEYELEYAKIAEQHKQASRMGRKLNEYDALEVIILATLARDYHIANSLIFRFSKIFPDVVVKKVEPLLQLGNARVKSALIRLLGLTNRPEGWSILSQHLINSNQPEYEGVRADLIATLFQALPADVVPDELLEAWLSSPDLIDPLTCLMTFRARKLNIPIEFLSYVNENYQACLKGWFEAY